MAVLIRILVAATALGIAVLVQNYRQMLRSGAMPKFDLNEHWGPGSAAKSKGNAAIVPFDISVKPELIEELKEKLARPLKLHEPLDGVAFEYGFNSKYLMEVISYWRDNYLGRWDEREKYLKKFPHYATEIQGLRIHFLHVKPSSTAGKKVLPLLLLHGWPGSVREFYDIIPLLTKPNPKSDYVFEVIAPSLPGYGWSQGSSKINFGPAQMAVVFRNLMVRLGFNKFLVQGGDWGSLIGADIATIFQDNTIGYHSNMCVSDHPLSRFALIISRMCPSLFIDKQYRDFYPPLSDQFVYLLQESGYMHLQATKPDTIGAALTDNPIGLAAYILEKFSTWTNPAYISLPDGGLTKRFSMDSLLDNVMIYYVTNSITTSQRLYAEALSKAQMGLGLEKVHVNVPMGCARFKHDIMCSTDCEMKYKYKNMLQSTHHADGGHFAAMEVPLALYTDFIEFVSKIKNV